MVTRLTIIGAIFILIGLLFIVFNTHFAYYFLYLNKLFVSMFTKKKVPLKNNPLKTFFRIVVVIAGLGLLLAGYAMVKV